MLIAVDGNEANIEKQVGVSVYTLSLLSYFQKKANKGLQFVVYLKRKPLPLLPESTEYFRYQVVKGTFFWSKIFLPLHLYTHRYPSVFFSPAHYSPSFCPVKLVVTIHDLSYLYYPNEFLTKDLYKLTHWTKNSIDKAEKIIAVSKKTKRDLIERYHVPDNKIEVIYNGYEKSSKVSTRGRSTSGRKAQSSNKWNLVKNKYILFVGTLQPRKNIITLIRAFALLKKQYQNYKLVITGKKGWLYKEIFQEVQSLQLEKNVICTDYVTDEELIMLYQRAFCLVMPSFYEGFGLPLLEAMSYSCPVISSFSSSLPEIGGDACLYFDPQSEQQLSDKIVELICQPSLRKSLIKNGLQRVQMFSWGQSGQQTLDILISVIQQK